MLRLVFTVHKWAYIISDFKIKWFSLALSHSLITSLPHSGTVFVVLRKENYLKGLGHEIELTYLDENNM